MLARRAPLVAFGILWFFLHLLPTNSILPRYDLLSERNLYLPSIGLYLAATATIMALTRWLGVRLASARLPLWVTRCSGVGAHAILAFLVIGLMALTVQRNAVYADPIAFWSDAVDKSPLKARPHAHLGRAWAVTGELDRAIEQFRIALELDRFDKSAQDNLLEVWTRKTQAGAQEQR